MISIKRFLAGVAAGLLCVSAATAQYTTPKDLYRTEVITLPGRSEAPVKTHIRVNPRDYVYYEVQGSVVLGPYVGAAYGDGTGKFVWANLNKYRNLRHGSVACIIGEQLVETEQVLTKSSHPIYGLLINEDRMVGDGFIKYIAGNYFVSEAGGTLEFDINDADPSNNSGEFRITVYVMSEAAHYGRNVFNVCPFKEPQYEGTIPKVTDVTGGITKDCKGSLWIFEKPNSWYYHGFNDSFRGTTGKSLGCQCVYDDDKLLTDDDDEGTFDIGMWVEKSMDSKEAKHLHLILDMMTHDLFTQINGKDRHYTGTSMYCK